METPTTSERLPALKHKILFWDVLGGTSLFVRDCICDIVVSFGKQDTSGLRESMGFCLSKMFKSTIRKKEIYKLISFAK